MSELQSAETTTPIEVVVTQPEPKTIEQTLAEVYDKNYPDSRVERDKSTGEFKSKETKVEEVKSEGAEIDTKSGDTEIETPQEPTTETVEPEETPAIDMPASWAADRKELWDKLSPDIKQFVADRESQAQSRLSELGRAVKATEPLKPHLEALEGLARANGLQSTDALQRLVTAGYRLQQDPKSAIQWLAQSYGVDLSQLAPSPQIGSDVPESAHINALTQKISQLERVIAETSHRMTSREQQEMAAREQTLTTSIEKYAEGKDYWSDIENEVLNQIVAIKHADPNKVQADPMAVLKEAEERAIKLTPVVSEKLEKAAKAEADKKAKEESAKKAAEAKRLASINVKSQAGSSPKSQFKSFEDEMTAVYDRVAQG